MIGLQAAITEQTTTGGGVLCFLKLSEVEFTQTGPSFAATAIWRILQNFYGDISFGPCLNGTVFELRASQKPLCVFEEGALRVDLGSSGGHFHLPINAPQTVLSKELPAREMIAAFTGASGLFGDTLPAQGIRLWNARREQIFNIFFDSISAWKAALASILSSTNIEVAGSTELSEDVAAWATDTAEARLLFNLRLLYSETFARMTEALAYGVPEKTRDLLATVPPGIGAERKARLSNLMHYFRRNGRFLPLILDEDQLREALRLWVSTPDFWAGRGRSLMESFCLYLYLRLAPRAPQHAELVRLEGVMSGLAHSTESGSPWKNYALDLDHEVESRDGDRTECFSSSYRVIEPDGGLSPALLSGIQSRGLFRVKVGASAVSFAEA